MNRTISIAILAGGIILLILGINAYDSTSSDISRFFSGSPTDKAIWMLIGGAGLSVLGLVTMLRGSKATS